MKIVCEHCGAKYSIADEKVAGKIFKIRCKKCEETLEVRGDQLEGGEEESTQLFDYGGEAVWYVVIDGEQQGPLAPIQLTALVAQGKASLDSFVWKEGFDDWKVASEVQELSQYLGSAGTADHPDESADAGLDPEDAPTTVSADAVESPSLSEASLFGPAEPAAPSAGGAGNMFAAFEGGATGAGAASSPSGPMTGQRNENSVLFSLNNLQQLATTTQTTGASTPAAATPASASADLSPGATGLANHATDGSGLIDIRQLAQATTPGSTPAPTSAQPGDLLGIGGTSASMTGGLAPVAMPQVEEERRSKLLWGALALVGSLAVAGAVMFMMGREEPSPSVVVNAGEAPTVVTTTDQAKKPAAEVATPTEPVEAPTPEQPSADLEPPVVAKAAPSKTKRRAATKSATKNTAKTAAVETKTTKSSNTRDKSIDQLMDEVLGGGSSKKKTSSPAKASSTDSALPSTPARADVGKALNGVGGAVRSCKKGDGGIAKVAVTFSGTSGRVSSAKVSNAPFKGTAVGKCIEGKVKQARVPRFKSSRFKVTFPYRL